MARSHQPSTRRSRQRHIADPRLHLLHVIDQSGKQSCFRSNAQPGHSRTNGDLHHLDRMRASQTTAWRRTPFGSLVTRPIRTRCQYHCFGIHQLVGKLLVRCNILSQPAHEICSSSGRSGPRPTTPIARRLTGHARCSLFS